MSTVAYDHQIFTLQRFGGISRYFCEIAARVGGDPDWRARVVAPLYFNEHLSEANVARIGWHLRMRVPRTTRLYRMANALLGPPLLRGCRADVLHRTYYTPQPRPPGGRLVITVFDMIHELLPQYFPADDAVREHKRRSVEAADQVICISHSTARDLQRLLDVPADKITVTHLAPSQAFESCMAARCSQAPRPYLLYVGYREGYKNFGRVLDAYAASPRLRADFDLVVFGGFPFDAEESARIAHLGLDPGRVRREVGSDADLACAYAGARAFVYPSEYEGFGIPPLEAMSCGCPVACSDTSSLPEVVGDAGEYFSPREVESIRAAMERLAYDDQRHAELTSAGHHQRGRFSWDRCADETLAVYRKALIPLA